MVSLSHVIADLYQVNFADLGSLLSEKLAKNLRLWHAWLIASIETKLSQWRHQMETCSELLALCARNSTVTGEFPTQRPVTRSFDVFFVLRLHKRLSKQSWGWWSETPTHPLWRHCNGFRRSSWCLKFVHLYKMSPHHRIKIIHLQLSQCTPPISFRHVYCHQL